jgi:hypothetical protein
MFRPNAIGKLSVRSGRDFHARETYSEPIDCPFAPVNLDNAAVRTTVRADSSASRGAADERVALEARILIVPYLNPKIGDRFQFEDIVYRIAGVHRRRSVFGGLDHYDCSLEALP